MIDWKQQVLDKISTGIVVLDSLQRVIYWNDEMEKLTEITRQCAAGNRLAELCPKLAQNMYQTIFENVFASGQSRFCSSALHKCFVVPAGGAGEDSVRQNMKIEPIWNGDRVEYAFLHISDVTEHIQNERRLRELNEKLSEGYRTVKASERAAKEMAKYDHLTGALNRCYLKAEFDKIAKRACAAGGKLALFFIDLDCFKRINDTYGHIVGDALLQHVAGRLINNTRHGKSRPVDVVARVGGDEFVIVLSGIKSADDVTLLADKIMGVLRKPFFVGNDKLTVTASIGIATFPDDAASINELIDMADKAMYKIKRRGKNNYRLCGGLGQALN